jgi:hypothetical protein
VDNSIKGRIYIYDFGLKMDKGCDVRPIGIYEKTKSKHNAKEK